MQASSWFHGMALLRPDSTTLFTRPKCFLHLQAKEVNLKNLALNLSYFFWLCSQLSKWFLSFDVQIWRDIQNTNPWLSLRDAGQPRGRKVCLGDSCSYVQTNVSEKQRKANWTICSIFPPRRLSCPYKETCSILFKLASRTAFLQMGQVE